MNAPRPIITRDKRDHAFCEPATPDSETLIYSEPGRVLDRKAHGGHCDVCYRSHWLTVTADARVRSRSYTLRVRHGGGDEAWPLDDTVVDALAECGSDARYFILYGIVRAHHDSERAAEGRVSGEYRQAFADGRLKKRKLRGQARCKVWIEPKPAEVMP